MWAFWFWKGDIKLSVNKVIVAGGNIEERVYEILINILGSGTVTAENMTTHVKTEYYKDANGDVVSRILP